MNNKITRAALSGLILKQIGQKESKVLAGSALAFALPGIWGLAIPLLLATTESASEKAADKRRLSESKQVAVPDVVAKTVRAAVTALDAQHFVVVEKVETRRALLSDESFAAKTVTRQMPAAGTLAALGSEVTVWVKPKDDTETPGGE